MSTKNIITRFPPSPTGALHMGNVRTAIFNFLFTRQNEGTFTIRVEDTDKQRSKREYEEDMLRNLKWLGINHDNDTIWRQSERTEVYKKYLNDLIAQGKAYISEETEGENREVVRFKNPNKVITFTDMIRGEVTIDTSDLGDFIIARNVNEPVYHLAVVVDDFEQGITHIIRGEDHISNTPRQILIQEAIGAKRPNYAHLPLILATDRTKLSKRKHGETVSLDYYKRLGYLPEAIVNFLALLGFNPGGDQEIFSLEELIKNFDLSKVQKGGAIFNIEKLNWFNKHYINKLTKEQKIENIQKFLSNDQIEIVKSNDKILNLMIERISTFGELETIIKSGDFDYFFGKPVIEIKEKILWKNEPSLTKTKERLSSVVSLLSEIEENSFNKDTVKNALWPLAEKEGRGEVLWPTRFSLSGKDKSPDPFVLADILGKKETLNRLNSAINLIS